MRNLIKSGILILIFCLANASAQETDVEVIDNKIDEKIISTIDQTTVTSPACTACASNCGCTLPKVEEKKKDPWDRSIAFGFNKTQGNSDTSLLTGSANISYAGDNNEFAFKANGSRGEADDEKNQEDVLAGVDYRRILAKRWYLGFGVEGLYDDIADIDYRINIKPTLGYYLLKKETVNLALELSPGYIFEKVGGIKNDYFAPRIANRFEWRITDNAKVFQSAEYILDTTNSDNYLANGEAGIEASIGPNLALVYSVRDNYRNIPAEGNKRNDIEILTTLKLSF